MMDGINMMEGNFRDINKHDVPNKRDGRKLLIVKYKNLAEL